MEMHEIYLVSSSFFFYLDRWSISCRQLSILWSYLDITLLLSSYLYLILPFVVHSLRRVSHHLMSLSHSLSLARFMSVRILSFHSPTFPAAINNNMNPRFSALLTSYGWSSFISSPYTSLVRLATARRARYATRRYRETW